MLVLNVFFFINVVPRVRVAVPLDKWNADSENEIASSYD